jgi:ADP-ribosylglycohydrolase
VPWEGRPPAALQQAELEPLGVREDWPRGSTSDDTAQLLLAAEVLVSAPGHEPARFMTALADALPTIPGTGPSTERAVAEYRSTGRLTARAGDTNGAAMRAPALGWAVEPGAKLTELTTAVSRTTHAGPGAVAAACTVATMASMAVEGRPREEIAAAAEQDGWQPPTAGVPLDAVATLAAVGHVIGTAQDPAEAMRAAVRLGGDTDTVAAIAGGILGTLMPAAPIPWLDQVRMPDAAALDRLAAGLARRRAA